MVMSGCSATTSARVALQPARSCTKSFEAPICGSPNAAKEILSAAAVLNVWTVLWASFATVTMFEYSAVFFSMLSLLSRMPSVAYISEDVPSYVDFAGKMLFFTADAFASCTWGLYSFFDIQVKRASEMSVPTPTVMLYCCSETGVSAVTVKSKLPATYRGLMSPLQTVSL